jgi:dihydroorotase
LSEFLTKVTTRPAELLGLRRGSLRSGTPADLTIFDPDVPWVIDAGVFRSKSKNTPFENHPVQGRAVMTIVGGNIVHRLDGN